MFVRPAGWHLWPVQIYLIYVSDLFDEHGSLWKVPTISSVTWSASSIDER